MVGGGDPTKLGFGIVMKIIIKNQQNASWTSLRPPAILDPAYFNLPEDQVLEDPRVHDPFTSPYFGRKCVIVQTEADVPTATPDEAESLATRINSTFKQNVDGLPDAE